MKCSTYIQPCLQRYFLALLGMPTVLIVSIATPVVSQEVIQVAQVLDSTSAQTQNAEVITQNFFTLLSQQKFEQAKQYISPSLKDYGSSEQLKQVWQRLLKTTGPFINILEVNATELLGNYTVILSAKFQASTEDFIVKLDQNRKITEIDFLWMGDIQSNANGFVNALAKGDYAIARSYLSPQLKEKVLPEAIKQRWQAVIAKTGSFKQIKSSSVLKSADYDIVQLNLDFQNYSGKFFVFFDPLGQIVGFDSPLKKR